MIIQNSISIPICYSCGVEMYNSIIRSDSHCYGCADLVLESIQDEEEILCDVRLASNVTYRSSLCVKLRKQYIESESTPELSKYERYRGKANTCIIGYCQL